MRFFIVAVLAFVLPCLPASEPSLQLWYPQPATTWMTQALPIGNGRLGAMLFGGVPKERIQFNEESLWIGDEVSTGAYQAFGDVLIDLTPGEATDYRRELDLRRAVHTVTYTSGGVRFRREAFASNPAQVMVFRFSADRPGALSGSIALTDMHRATITAAADRLEASGTLAGEQLKKDPPYALALTYASQVRVRHTGGTVTVVDGKLVFAQLDELTLFLDAATDFAQDRSKGWREGSPKAKLAPRLDAAVARSWDDLLAEHVRDYQSLFNRVAIDLGPALAPTLATDALLRQVTATRAADPGLDALTFQYGRYLLIASSRAGGLPSNLQGRWNDSNNPPWRCDYHTDVNIQMNYWLADPANLSECFAPYAAWVDSIRAVRTAATVKDFAKPGWLMRGESGLFGGSTWDWIPGTSAWLLQNSYDHFRFTGDREYLARYAYPAMKEVCAYWQASLIAQPDGTLVTPIGLSPEHGPKEPGISFDQQLVWDLFTNIIEASTILGVDPELRAELTAKRAKLLPPKIGKWGQLQEWMVDRDDPKNTHRHLSHLVAVFPGRQIAPATTPELAQAARVSLDARGDVSTGWSTAQKINTWARLQDGDRAYKLVTNFLTLVGDTGTNYAKGGGVYANLLCAHPPFQIDGNFGYTSGVCEMLLQSHVGEVHLLPALPKAWATGSVSGLRARTGLTVDLAWREGKLQRAVIRSALGGPCTVRLGAKTVDVKLAAGATVTLDGELVAR